MKKFFNLHVFSENMKSKIVICNLKGKTDISWEDVKHVRGIREEDLSWHEFKRIFRKKYFYERYYYGKDKEFYELNMGSLIDEECTTKFLELLRYVPYLKDEKTKVQRFINRFPLAFKDHNEYDEPRSLEEVIKKLKHCYEQSKCKPEFKRE